MDAPPTTQRRTTPSRHAGTPLLGKEGNSGCAGPAADVGPGLAPARPPQGAASPPRPSRTPSDAVPLEGSGDKPRRRQVCTDVAKLAPEWRGLAEQLIVDGFTFEDVEETFKERQGPRVTLHALETFYISNAELQKRRVRNLIEQADKLKRAMANPASAEAQLANATLFTGLLRLSRRSALLTIKDAHSIRLQRENLQLRKRLLNLRLAEAARRKDEAHQRYVYEQERRRKLTLENQKLEEILKKLRQDQTLPPDVMTKIQEIYGIVKEPYLAHKLAEKYPQSETL
jgi:hypothetical protein